MGHIAKSDTRFSKAKRDGLERQFIRIILGVLENPSFDVLTSLRGTIQIRL